MFTQKARFVVFDLACGSSGLALLLCVREFASGCRQGLQLASKSRYPVSSVVLSDRNN